MSKPIALYARVSTPTQKTTSQFRQLRRYARDRGADHPIEFRDQGISGAKDSRPALDKMIEAARRREISAVVCTKLDRLARLMPVESTPGVRQWMVKTFGEQS